MAVDYDLVVLGWTTEAQLAAQRAAQQGARVAWVQGLYPPEEARSPRYRSLWMAGMLRFPPSPDADPVRRLAAWQTCQQQAHLTATLLTQDDLDEVRAQGVDVIAEPGRVTGDRPLHVATTTRHLTTRALLLATGRSETSGDLSGTNAAWLTQATPPSSLTISRHAPLSLAVAQVLRRWGVAVTVVTPDRRLLPQADPDVSQWLLANLQADGVLIADQEMTRQEESFDSPASVDSVDALAPATELPTPPQLTPPPSLKDFGLDAWFAPDRPIPVNRFLRTGHPRIYACGAVLGGEDWPAIASQEAEVAVDNALFWPRRPIDYRTLPYQLPTQPPIAGVGLTAPQAHQRYGKEKVQVARIPLHGLPVAQWQGATTGFCKLIAHRNGQLLGAHGAGVAAPEWVQTIALLMAQRCPWWAIARQSFLPDSALALLHQTVQGWEGDRWQPGTWRRDGAENWFNWQRSR